ncbi:hypothetical protein [Chitinophaga sp. YIM B06452]|uniref:hypothetical protein n=1 Tax=Chitinophaga sp. YIM B06452 TaxID=3082158 RepID=UPI0031FEC89F
MLGIETLLLIPFAINSRLFNKEQRIIYIYLISAVFYGIGCEVLARLYGNNMAFISCMMLVQFYILSLFYLKVLKSEKVHRYIRILLVVCTAIFVADITVLEGPLKFNSIFISIRTFVLIVYAILFFLQLMRDENLIEQSIFINSLPVFWFNAGIFVEMCCSFMLNLSFNMLQQMGVQDLWISIYRITAALTWIAGIIQVFLFYIGLRKIKKAKA